MFFGISHNVPRVVWQRPIHIYVPLDTIRDYLYVDDCAQQILACLAAWLSDRLPQPAAGGAQLKLFAAERTATVAQIVGAKDCRWADPQTAATVGETLAVGRKFAH